MLGIFPPGNGRFLIGGKIFAADLLGVDKIPPLLSLAVTLGLIAGGIVWSLARPRPQPPSPAADEAPAG